MPTTSRDDIERARRRTADDDLREQAAAFELLHGAGTAEERDRDEQQRRATERWLRKQEP